ncbi:MAG: ABC transporter permease [Clostridia bacterium]|nr:ABC transporter permease [Clostridia bacterium]
MMSLILGFKSAWLGLMGNKVRAFLTMLGVIIGVCSVITLVSVATGARQQMMMHMESMGTNVIQVYSQGWNVRFTLDDLKELEERVPTIKAAIPNVENWTYMRWRNHGENFGYSGTTEKYLVVTDSKLARGRFLTEGDVLHRRRVAVVGDQVVEVLFKGTNPMGQNINIQGQNFLVVGVMERKGKEYAIGPDSNVFIPVTSAMRLMATNQIHGLSIKANSAEDTRVATVHLKRIFQKKYGHPDAVGIHSQQEWLQQVEEMNRIMTLVMGAIASISLLVGGIGIMNIMLVSVTERTREIGIKKSLGAMNHHILIQFLVESVIISGVGGVIGIILGFGGANLVGMLGPETAVSLTSVIVSFGFAVGVGVIFGVWPAMKAASMKPVEALQRE